MRKYYLFRIQKEVYQLYFEKSCLLYKTLENLYHLKNKDFHYGVTLYQQLCSTFDVNVLKHYILGKYETKQKENLILIEKQLLVTLRPSCIIVETKYNLPYIMSFFYYYSKTIFICDFENHDYFWLSEMRKIPI